METKALLAQLGPLPFDNDRLGAMPSALQELHRRLDTPDYYLGRRKPGWQQRLLLIAHLVSLDPSLTSLSKASLVLGYSGRNGPRDVATFVCGRTKRADREEAVCRHLRGLCGVFTPKVDPVEELPNTVVENEDDVPTVCTISSVAAPADEAPFPKNDNEKPLAVDNTPLLPEGIDFMDALGALGVFHSPTSISLAYWTFGPLQLLVDAAFAEPTPCPGADPQQFFRSPVPCCPGPPASSGDDAPDGAAGHSTSDVKLMLVMGCVEANPGPVSSAAGLDLLDVLRSRKSLTYLASDTSLYSEFTTHVVQLLLDFPLRSIEMAHMFLDMQEQRYLQIQTCDKEYCDFKKKVITEATHQSFLADDDGRVAAGGVHARLYMLRDGKDVLKLRLDDIRCPGTDKPLWGSIDYKGRVMLHASGTTGQDSGARAKMCKAMNGSSGETSLSVLCSAERKKDKAFCTCQRSPACRARGGALVPGRYPFKSAHVWYAFSTLNQTTMYCYLILTCNSCNETNNTKKIGFFVHKSQNAGDAQRLNNVTGPLQPAVRTTDAVEKEKEVRKEQREEDLKIAFNAARVEHLPVAREQATDFVNRYEAILADKAQATAQLFAAELPVGLLDE